MPTYSQNANVTFGDQSLTEVTSYDIRMTPWGTRDRTFGTVEVQAFDPMPSARLYSLSRLTISHQGVEVFRGACYLTDYQIRAVGNDVVRYVMSFTIYYIQRV